VSAACAAVRAWTWLYTLPLDPAAQRDRRDEIESDIWEFRHDGARPNAEARAAVHIIAGAVLAMPDDLLWTCEQLPRQLKPPQLSTILRCAIVIVAASSLAVSASGPTLDIARLLRVNVAAAGWMPVDITATEATLVPAFAFTVTNIGDRATGALHVNAVFYQRGAGHQGMGTAFSPIVGWRGLTPGATSARVVVQGRSRSLVDRAAVTLLAPLRSFGVDESRIKLVVQHEGRWTLLGSFAIRGDLIQP
jgi:hypothetical protein